MILTVLLPLLAPPAASCAPADIAAQGRAVADARARLAAVTIEDMQTEIDAETQGRIEGLKDRVVDFVAASVACALAGEAPAPIERRLEVLGDAVVDPRDFGEAERPRPMHGAGLSYDVAVPPGHPGLLAVVARIGIECGEDAVFMLFDRSGGGARPLMIRRSAPYDEISGAWQNLNYAVSTPDAHGRWYAATAHVPAWCTSSWRSVTYDLARPAADPARPDLFFSRRVGTYLGNETGTTLRAEAGRFQVEHDGSILDPSIIVRRHVETYAVEDRAVRRVQPAAFNVRDFVDEWLDAPWELARSWSAPDPQLGAAHRSLAAELRSDDLYFEFGPIRACPGGTHEVMLEGTPARPSAAAAIWSLTVSGSGPYRVERASRTASGGCRGPDLREEIEAESRRRIYGVTAADAGSGR